jgi:iron complex outermembrane recepter protein
MARIATLLLLAVFLGTSPAPAKTEDTDQAAEDPQARLERMLITGTRLRRIDLEGPLPVTSIDRAEIEASGHTTLSDFLRDLSFNAFGTLLDAPTQRVPGQRLLNLRGLGPQYTLVLLDGQRLPGNSALAGGAVTNVAGLPLAAIERVEVLRDGASAVYGSEAIGGVINLVTRRGVQPLTLGAQFDRPSDGGGRMHAADLLLGHEYVKGDWLVALQVSGREPLRATQRPYLVENAPLSPFGAPGSLRRFHPDTGAVVGAFEPDPRCPDQPGDSSQFPSSGRSFAGPIGEFCGYRFRDDNFEQTGLDSMATFASLRQDLTGHLVLGARLMLWRSEGESELAASPATVTMHADNPFNPTRGELGPERGFNLLVPYRLTPLGPRRSESRDDNLHLAVHLDGDHERGHWRLGLQHNQQSLRRRGVSGYARLDSLQSILASGDFDPFTAVPGEPGALADALFEPSQRGRSRSSAVEASAGSELFELKHGPIETVVGASLRRDYHRLEFDGESQRGNIIGSPGGADADAGRTHMAAYIETLVPMPGKVEANLAMRYDRYQKSGEAFSPRLALAWRATEALLVRGAVGRGFRVIDLEAGFAATTRSFAFVTDQVRCAATPDDPQACAPVPVEAEFRSNPALDPEYARQAAVGMVWQPGSQTSVALDFYQVRLRDQIARLTLNEVALNELDCVRDDRECDPLRDGRVERDMFGNMALVVVPAVNIAQFQTRGVDLDFSQGFAAGPGRALVGVRFSRVLRFERQLRPGQPSVDTLGLFGRPRQRATASGSYALGGYDLLVAIRYVGGFRACFDRLTETGEPQPLCQERVRSHTEFDLRGTAELPWDAHLALGVRNVANRKAPLTVNGELAYGLHDIVGRVPYLRYEQRF